MLSLSLNYQHRSKNRPVHCNRSALGRSRGFSFDANIRKSSCCKVMRMLESEPPERVPSVEPALVLTAPVPSAVIHRTPPGYQNQTKSLAGGLQDTNIILLQRGSGTMAANKCCFCGRNVDQVTHLIQGPDLFICDICVDACVDTLATKDHGWRERQIDYLLRLRNRRTLAAGN
jgi:ClpX C4-type zinc finger protein